jgi:cell division protein FtsB
MNVSLPTEPLLAEKEAAVKPQQAPLPPKTSDSDEDEDIDQFMDEFESDIQDTVTTAEAKARERKRLEEEVKDKEDKLNAIRNAPKPEATSDIPDNDGDVEVLMDKVVAGIKDASTVMTDLVQTEKRLTEEVAAGKARIVEMEETEKDLRDELRKTKEERDKLADENADLKKELAATKQELLDELARSAGLRLELDALRKEYEEYKQEAKRKLSRVMDGLKTSKKLLQGMVRR